MQKYLKLEACSLKPSKICNPCPSVQAGLIDILKSKRIEFFEGMNFKKLKAHRSRLKAFFPKIFTTFAGSFFEKDMNDSDFQQIIYSKNVVEFVTVASEFCATIEQVSRHEPLENLGKLQKMLPLLYLKAAVLPEVERLLEDELEKFVSELDYNTLHQKWLGQLGGHDDFYEVFDPNIQFGSETVTASLSENLMDIYQDLKDFVTSYSIGNEEVMNDSLAECVFHFREFWGQQLVNVLRAVHMLVINETDFATNDNDQPEPGKGNPKWLDNFWGTNEEED